MSGINIIGLHKSFGKKEVLRDIHVSFEPGKIYGLLGRNGAGKTTLLNIINNRLFADSGTLTCDGETCVENDRALGKMFLMNDQNLYPESMNVKKAFFWSGQFYPDFDLKYACELAETFELPLKAKIKNLSTGYQTIFKWIVALSVNVPYVFLDEPILGLDAGHRELFYECILQKYAQRGCTIVLSTHLIEEIKNLIEDVVILHKGEILAAQSKDAFIGRGCVISGRNDRVDAFCQGRNRIGEENLGSLKHVYLLDEDLPAQLPEGLEKSRVDLQKLFVKLTERRIGNGE